MLILPIQKKWFDMIKEPEPKKRKLEEYREIKPYYTKRFQTIGLLNKNGEPTNARRWICFRNGYSSESPTLAALCYLEVKKGRPEWGADPDKEYYALCIERSASLMIRMLCTVRPNPSLAKIYPGKVLKEGRIYNATRNKDIAVCENGTLLGIKPGEFEIFDPAKKEKNHEQSQQCT